MPTPRARTPVHALMLLAATLLLGACDYEVPLTPTPTRSVDDRLLGDWVSTDDEMTMKVRRLDASTYIVVCDGDLYRVHHSDVAGTPFLSVQELDSDARKYAFLTWAVSADGTVLTLRVLRSEVVPNTLRDAASLQQSIKAHQGEPGLFGTDVVFRRAKA